MSWSITVADRALCLGPFDNWIYQKDASHGFLRVRNDKDETVLELHGCAMSSYLRRGDTVRHTLLLAFAFVADNVLGRPANIGLRLHVKALTVKKSMDELGKGRPVEEHEIYRGSEEEVKRRIECALRAAKQINRSHLRYVFYSLDEADISNCHSVKSFMSWMVSGTDLPPSEQFANPGIEQNLQALDPKLRKIEVDRKSSFAAVSKSIAKLLPKIDVDKFASSLAWVSSSSISTASRDKHNHLIPSFS